MFLKRKWSKRESKPKMHIAIGINALSGWPIQA